MRTHFIALLGLVFVASASAETPRMTHKEQWGKKIIGLDDASQLFQATGNLSADELKKMISAEDYEKYLKDNYGEVAGDLHMVGDDGLVKLLEKNGFEVTFIGKTVVDTKVSNLENREVNPNAQEAL